MIVIVTFHCTWLYRYVIVTVVVYPSALTEAKHHEKRLSQISDFDKTRMHHTDTVEKDTLPDKTGEALTGVEINTSPLVRD